MTVRVALVTVPEYLAEMVIRHVMKYEKRVETVNDAVVAPAGMVTVAGTEAMKGMLLERVTWIPPAGAGPVKVTVPVELPPARMLVGFRVKDARDTVPDRMDSVAVLVTPFRLAVIRAFVDEVTVSVVTVKVAVALPAATLTDDGTIADKLLLERLTERPPAGAGPVRVTVPVDGLPPTTDVGFSDTDDNAAGGVMVSPAVLFKPL